MQKLRRPHALRKHCAEFTTNQCLGRVQLLHSSIDMSPSASSKLMVVPVDFSKPSLRALHWAFEYATVTSSVIHIVHVVERTVRLGDLMSRDIESLRTELQDVKSSVAEQLQDVAPDAEARERIGELHRHVMIGKPAEEICGFAREIDADLIVMGTHGHTGVRRLLVGSVAGKVVREAPCTVVCVKGKETS